MFNTLKYAKLLEEAGFSREQAETSIKIPIEIMEEKLATKQDISELKSELATKASKQDIAELKSELATKADKQDIAEFKQDLLQLKYDLTLKLGAMISAAVAVVEALHKFT
jgi:hypothetical protein